MRSITLLVLVALKTIPCFAAGLSAADVEARLAKGAAECPAEGVRLTIERVDVVGAREHNRLRRSLGAKTDGREGQHYVTVVARHGRQTASVASFGPVDPAVTSRDLQRLRGSTYCDHDES